MAGGSKALGKCFKRFVVHEYSQKDDGKWKYLISLVFYTGMGEVMGEGEGF